MKYFHELSNDDKERAIYKYYISSQITGLFNAQSPHGLVMVQSFMLTPEGLYAKCFVYDTKVSINILAKDLEYTKEVILMKAFSRDIKDLLYKALDNPQYMFDHKCNMFIRETV